jgi:hypothetical protein
MIRHRIKLLQYHTLGNDYLVENSAEKRRPDPELIKRICQRNFGISPDGLSIVALGWKIHGIDKQSRRQYGGDQQERRPIFVRALRDYR